MGKISSNMRAEMFLDSVRQAPLNREELATKLASHFEEHANAAFEERDLVVLLAVKLAQRLDWPAWLAQHDPLDTSWDPKWRWIVFIEAPTGQLSWHIHEDEFPLFEFLRSESPNDWDGHSVDEKYERIKKIGTLPPRQRKEERHGME